MKFKITALTVLVLILPSAASYADTPDRLQIDKTLTGRDTPDYYKAIHTQVGFDQAPGGQNFRTVIPGVLYRAGTGATTGFSQTQLQVFCKEGFSNVTFGYDGGKLGPVSCDGNSFDYEFANPNVANDAYQLMSRVSSAVNDDKGPVMMHCWRGHHESGQMAAYALELYCGFTADQAIKYWDLTSNGDAAIGANVHKRLKWFASLIQTDSRFAKLASSADVKSLCPQAP